MLEKKFRMDRKTVSLIFKEGKSVFSPFFTLKYEFLENKKEVSFIVPKTVSKKAVTRNLLRRRGYSAIKEIMTSVPAGFHGAFLFNKKSLEPFGVKKNNQNNPILDIKNELKKILNKIN